MYQHKNPAMLKPLIIMAHVLLFINVPVQAQSSINNSSNTLCLIRKDNDAQKVDLYITQTKPVTITCNNQEHTTVLPKYVKFTCTEGSSWITVQVNITDGTHNQTITKDVEITEKNTKYEVSVLSVVNYEILQSGKAQIKSIVFKNNKSTDILLKDLDFTNASMNYEIKLNQIFTVDLNEESQKNYFVNVKSTKDVNINLYKTNGQFDHSISKNLATGENYIHFNDMQLNAEKYIVVISDIIPNKKAPNDKITVMY